jgi:hypothetical protein
MPPFVPSIIFGMSIPALVVAIPAMAGDTRRNEETMVMVSCWLNCSYIVFNYSGDTSFNTHCSIQRRICIE